jgi:pimeloyl-ACP methyl ester carboxylesterase
MLLRLRCHRFTGHFHLRIPVLSVAAIRRILPVARSAEATVTERSPVVFIHDLWLHASSWDQWVHLITTRGYAAIAPGWPGDGPTAEGTRERPGALADQGINDVIEHYARIACGLGGRPVLIGHGLGGLLAQALAAETPAAGAVTLESVPVSAMLAVLPRAAGRGTVALGREEFRVVFGSAVSRQESDRLYDRWAIPAPGRVLREAVQPDGLPPRSGVYAANSDRAQLLLMMSGASRRRAAGQPAPTGIHPITAVDDVAEFPDRGPSLVIDDGWRSVAESCLSWMDAHEL